MNTPLDIAVGIGRIVCEARTAGLALDLGSCADELLARFPETGLSRPDILAALVAEAGAVGVAAGPAA